MLGVLINKECAVRGEECMVHSEIFLRDRSRGEYFFHSEDKERDRTY
jgi:hypothetical protein